MVDKVRGRRHLVCPRNGEPVICQECRARIPHRIEVWTHFRQFICPTHRIPLEEAP